MERCERDGRYQDVGVRWMGEKGREEGTPNPINDIW